MPLQASIIGNSWEIIGKLKCVSNVKESIHTPEKHQPNRVHANWFLWPSNIRKTFSPSQMNFVFNEFEVDWRGISYNILMIQRVKTTVC